MYIYPYLSSLGKKKKISLKGSLLWGRDFTEFYLAISLVIHSRMADIHKEIILKQLFKLYIDRN